MSHPRNPHNQCCPHCGNYLVVQVTVGGKVLRSSFLRCGNSTLHPDKQPWFYRFPPETSNLVLATPIAAPPQEPAEPAFTSYDDAQNFVMAPFRALDAYRVSESARVAEEGRQLDRQLDHQPRTRQEQELSDYQLALQLSQDSNPSTFLPVSPTPRPLGLRALSLSPEFPSRLLHPPPAPNATGDLNGVGIPSVPRRRVPAPSTQPLRLTTQMNETWMSSNGGPQIHGQAQTRSAASLHIRTGSSRRPFEDPQAVQRFIVVLWTADDKPHRVCYVESCPSWPRWRVSESTGALRELVVDEPDIDMYFPSFKTWVEISVDFSHKVDTDCVILLRLRGVSCLDEEETIKRFLSDTSPSHLRYNLPGERSALCMEYKRQRGAPSAVSIYDNDSSSDSGLQTRRKRPLKEKEMPAR
ncbi:hypothetical protein C8R44DRAFT_893892 [Mycena epipterygia]|nr:hypothetical protein C8R44DRAFT_893892 [Mycena epipterygia]